MKTTMHEWRRTENTSLGLSFCPVIDRWTVSYLPTSQFGRGVTPDQAKLELYAVILKVGIQPPWWKTAFQGNAPNFISDYEDNS